MLGMCPESGSSSPEGRENPRIIRLFRGTAANSREAALSVGLNIKNMRITYADDPTPPGLFFYVDDKPTGGIGFATSSAQREGRLPVVVEIDVTPENFHLLRGKLRWVDELDHRDYRYRHVFTFNSLQRKRDTSIADPDKRREVTVAMERLSHHDLVDLGVKVGFQEDSTFVFKEYEVWRKELNMRAPEMPPPPRGIFTLFRRANN